MGRIFDHLLKKQKPMPCQYKREPLDDEEVNNLTNACETFKEKSVIWTLLDTGLRLSELAGLTKGNVQWQERRLVIYGRGGPYGKKSKRRITPMTDRVRRLIEYHSAEHDTICMSKRTVARVVKRVANKAEISKPVSPHVLRHTFAVNCVKKGISTRVLQTLLGHDRLATAELYLNLSPEDAIREFLDNPRTNQHTDGI